MILNANALKDLLGKNVKKTLMIAIQDHAKMVELALIKLMTSNANALKDLLEKSAKKMSTIVKKKLVRMVEHA